MTLKERFTRNPQTYYALSIAATWAGIGSLMNGVTMTQTYGAIPSLIWVIGNVLACILFGAVACKIPKVREVFRSRPMEYICAVMCVFQAWLSMNGMQTVFADTALGPNFGKYVAYALAVIFLIILLKFGMIRNVLTDGFGWIIVYLMAAGVTIAALVFTYPYFFKILDYNDRNEDGAVKVKVRRAFTMGGVYFGIYMAIVFPLAWTQFTPVLNIVKAILITIIGTSTLSSSMYSIYIAFGKKAGLAVNAALIAGWSILIPLGVMGMWTLMASVRIYFVGAGILFAICWNAYEKRKAVRA